MGHNKTINSEALTFDDVLLIPNYSETKRENIDVSTYLTKNFKLSIPLVSSPMDTVTTSSLAIALGKLGGLGIIHRNLSINDQVEEVKKVKKENLPAGAAIGVGHDFEERLEALNNVGVNVLVVDSAHGFSKWVVEATELITQNYKQINLVCGNIATAAGAKALIDAGAQGLRVGMGPGSICTTRIIAGIGIPQLTAILETAEVAKEYNIPLIADGGLRSSGDIVKALAAGASTVMSGSFFAGTHEAPGKLTTLNGKKYKSYQGMGSIPAMIKGSAVRYGQNYRKGQEKKLVPEGVSGLAPYKGSVEDVVTQLIGGLRSGMYYAGVKNIKQLQERTRFVKITHSSLIESYPHDIIENSATSY